VAPPSSFFGTSSSSSGGGGASSFFTAGNAGASNAYSTPYNAPATDESTAIKQQLAAVARLANSNREEDKEMARKYLEDNQQLYTDDELAEYGLQKPGHDDRSLWEKAKGSAMGAVQGAMGVISRPQQFMAHALNTLGTGVAGAVEVAQGDVKAGDFFGGMKEMTEDTFGSLADIKGKNDINTREMLNLDKGAGGSGWVGDYLIGGLDMAGMIATDPLSWMGAGGTAGARAAGMKTVERAASQGLVRAELPQLLRAEGRQAVTAAEEKVLRDLARQTAEEAGAGTRGRLATWALRGDQKTGGVFTRWKEGAIHDVATGAKEQGRLSSRYWSPTGLVDESGKALSGGARIGEKNIDAILAGGQRGFKFGGQTLVGADKYRGPLEARGILNSRPLVENTAKTAAEVSHADTLTQMEKLQQRMAEVEESKTAWASKSSERLPGAEEELARLTEEYQGLAAKLIDADPEVYNPAQMVDNPELAKASQEQMRHEHKLKQIEAEQAKLDEADKAVDAQRADLQKQIENLQATRENLYADPKFNASGPRVLEDASANLEAQMDNLRNQLDELDANDDYADRMADLSEQYEQTARLADEAATTPKKVYQEGSMSPNPELDVRAKIPAEPEVEAEFFPGEPVNPDAKNITAQAPSGRPLGTVDYYVDDNGVVQIDSIRVIGERKGVGRRLIAEVEKATGQPAGKFGPGDQVEEGAEGFWKAVTGQDVDPVTRQPIPGKGPDPFMEGDKPFFHGTPDGFDGELRGGIDDPNTLGFDNDAGPGIYTADQEGVANEFSRLMGDRATNPQTNTVHWKGDHPPQFLDMRAGPETIPEDAIAHLRQWFAARGAELPPFEEGRFAGANEGTAFDWFQSVKREARTLAGDDAEQLDELARGFSKKIEDAGFDGIEHEGLAVAMGDESNTHRIIFRSENIESRPAYKRAMDKSPEAKAPPKPKAPKAPKGPQPQKISVQMRGGSGWDARRFQLEAELPPVPEGHTRIFKSASGGGADGRGYWAEEPLGGYGDELYYSDVPTDDLAQYRGSENGAEGQYVFAGDNRAPNPKRIKPGDNTGATSPAAKVLGPAKEAAPPAAAPAGAPAPATKPTPATRKSLAAQTQEAERAMLKAEREVKRLREKVGVTAEKVTARAEAKAKRLAARHAELEAKAAKLGDRIPKMPAQVEDFIPSKIPGATKAQTVLRRAFVTGSRTADEHGSRAAQAIKNLREMALGQAEHASNIAVRTLRNGLHAAAGEDRKFLDELPEIYRSLETGDASAVEAMYRAQGREKAADAVLTLRNMNAEDTAAVVAEGYLPEEFLSSTGGKGGYMKRVETKKAAKARRDATAGTRRGSPARPASMFKQDAVQGSTHARTSHAGEVLTDELQASFAAERGLPEGTKVIEDNPFYSVGEHRTELEHRRAHDEFIRQAEELTDDAGLPLVTRDADLARTHGYVSVPTPQGQVWAPPAIAEDVANFQDVVFNDETIKAFGRTMDKTMRIWKAHATVPLVGMAFHSRNAETNVMLNWIAGVENPVWYARSAKAQLKVEKAMKNLGPDVDFETALAKSGLTKKEQNAVKLAMDHNVLTSSQANVDLADIGGSSHADQLSAKSAEPGLRGRAKRAPQKANFLSPEHFVGTKSGRWVSSGLENNARLAHFMWALDKYGDAEIAAQSVKKYLFNYADLTPFERRVMKRAIPFYTFMRKNTALMLTSTAENPGKMSRFAMAQKQLQDETKGGPDFLKGNLIPGYITEQGQAPSKVPGLGGLTASIESPWSAAADTLAPVGEIAGMVPVANRFVPGEFKGKGPEETALKLLNIPGGPVAEAAKYVAERALGKDTFTGGDVRKMNPLGEGLRITDIFAPSPSKVTRLTDKLTQGDVTGKHTTPAEGDERTRRRSAAVINAIFGLNTNAVGPQATEAEITRRFYELADYIDVRNKDLPATLKDGVTPNPKRVPTIEELRDAGILPSGKRSDPYGSAYGN
jgi:hypothetical protein